MHDFHYDDGCLKCESVSLKSLADKYGTPLYVYSQQTLGDHFLKLTRALSELDHSICFAMKANSNQAVLRLFANMGGGFDTVSAGEIMRVKAAGGDPGKCVFAGVGKKREEIAFALEQGIYSFNVESEAELTRIHEVALSMGLKAPVAIRVNPNVDAHTHAKITTGTYENKFGVAFEKIEELYAQAAQLSGIEIRGVQMHIGSQLTEVKPFESAVKKVLPLVEKLKSQYPTLKFFSIGGGLGIVYNPALESGSTSWWQGEEASKILTPASYAETLVPLLKPLGLKILLEPGRFLAGNAGALVTRVEYVKNTGQKNFVIVDAAMNDLIRPAFYDSYHQIAPVDLDDSKPTVASDVVGPICESGDTFCKERPLQKMVEGDFLAILSAGAYGFVMASNYNTRPMAAEVLVHGDKAALVRKRQAVEAIWDGESVPDWM